MVLTGHKLRYCQADSYSIAVRHIERLFKSLHGAFFISQRTERFSGSDEYRALTSLLVLRQRYRLSVLLRHLHVLQGVIPIAQLSIGTRELGINQRIVRG